MHPRYSQLFLVLLLLPLLALSAESPPSQKPAVFLAVGEQRSLKIPELAKYSLGGNCAKAHPFPHLPARSTSEALLIKGISPGVCDLWIWKKDGSSEYRTLRIIQPSRSSLPTPLEKALQSLDEIEVIFTGQGTLLRGEIQTRAEWIKLGRILETFPKEITDETTISPSLFEEGKQAVENWISSSRHSRFLQTEVGPHSSGPDLLVRGYIPNLREKLRIEKYLRRLFPTIQLDISSNPDSSVTVHFKVFLLELNRSSFQNLGLSWSPQIFESLQVSTSGLAGTTQIDWVLNQLEGKGHARVLSRPELVVRAPGEAELFSGGEIPIQTHTRFSSNVTWRNYGLTLRLKVYQVTGPQIRLDIYTEVSHIDPQISQDQIPGLQVNRMKTQVDARFEAPLLLSGLLQQGIREEIKGLPFLKSIPVLGKLFGSENFLNHKSEFVALLYPRASPRLPSRARLKRLLPRGSPPLPRNWVEPTEEQALRNSENFPWNTLE